MARPKGTTKSVNIGARVTPETDLIWETMATYLGISKVACLEQALRRMARQEGLLDGGRSTSEELQSMLQALKTSSQEKPAHQDIEVLGSCERETPTASVTGFPARML